MLQNLETLAREARSWPFEQARNLLAHVLKKRLPEAERAALDTEAERLRLSRVALRERLLGLVGRSTATPAPSFELACGTMLTGEVTGRIIDCDEDADGGGVRLDVDGEVRRIAYADVKKALVQIEFNRRPQATQPGEETLANFGSEFASLEKRLRGSADSGLTTAEIMALTRE